MPEWRVTFHRQARKDAELIERAGLTQAVEQLLSLLATNPYASPPQFERLRGDMRGFYSRRINRQHRLVYDVVPERKEVRVLRMWSHYEGL